MSTTRATGALLALLCGAAFLAGVAQGDDDKKCGCPFPVLHFDDDASGGDDDALVFAVLGGGWSVMMPFCSEVERDGAPALPDLLSGGGKEPAQARRP